MEEKIISAIEKLSRVQRFLLWNIGKNKSLTPLQIQILIYLNKHSLKFSQLSKISQEFGLSKATLSKALDTLKRKGLIAKEVSSQDRRCYQIVITPLGSKYMIDLSSWSREIKEQLKKFPYETKEKVMFFLMELIASLREKGIISVARMCISCDNFLQDILPDGKRRYYCKLLGQHKAGCDLNIDCEEFILRK